MTSTSDRHAAAELPQTLPHTPWIRRLPLRSPTLPPAMHTNAYVLGENELLAVDPGTPWSDAQRPLFERLHELGNAGHKLKAILLTHHHPDHMLGAEDLARAFDVPLWAHAETARRLQGSLAQPISRLLSDGEHLPFGPDGFRVLHTPGHAPGHVCLLDEAGGGLIAGDMVASQGTIVIAPSDAGDMSAYLASLRRLLALPAQRIWPAHGVAVEDGPSLLSYYLSHRLLREEKILAVLARGPQSIAALVPEVYDDTPPALFRLAQETLYAHLLSLLAQGRVAQNEKAAIAQWFVVSR